MDLRLLGQVVSNVGKSAIGTAADAASSLASGVRQPGGAAGGESDDNEGGARERLTSTGQALIVEDWTQQGGISDVENDFKGDERDTAVSSSDFKKMIDRYDRSRVMIKTDDELPRRFSVKLRNFILEAEESECVIMIGGTIREVRVKSDWSKNMTTPQVAGYFGDHFITNYYTLNKSIPLEINFQTQFEWRGSYNDLDQENLKIEVWEAKGLYLNQLIGSYEEPLRAIVDASVARAAFLKPTTHSPPLRLTFMMEFQEIYDFPLNLCNLSVSRSQNDTDVSPFNIEEQHDALEEFLKSKYSGKAQLRFVIRADQYNKWRLALSSPSRELPYLGNWDFMGNLMFRGTTATLDQTAIEISLRDTVKPKQADKPYFRGQLSIKNIVGTPNFSTILVDEKYPEFNVQISGSCGIPSKPRFRQSGQVLDISDENVYVFIKLLNIDKIHPQSSLEEELDCFAEVSFCSEVKLSSISRKTFSPHFQSELIFKIPDLSSDDIKTDVLDALGPCCIDIWGTSSNAAGLLGTGLRMGAGTGIDGSVSTYGVGLGGQQHLGWTELSLGEILEDLNRQPGRKPSVKHYFDRRRARESSYETRVLPLSRKLTFSWETLNEISSTLEMEIWTKPDLGDLHLKPATTTASGQPTFQASQLSRFDLPPLLQPKLSPLISEWERELDYSVHHRCLAIDERGRLVPLDLLVNPVKLPSEIASPVDCMNMARAIRFIDGFSNHCCSLDWTLKTQRGTIIEHATCLTSFLNGFGLNSFVCLGRLKYVEDAQHAWVFSAQNTKTGIVYWMWELVGNIIFQQKAHGQVPDIAGTPSSRVTSEFSGTGGASTPNSTSVISGYDVAATNKEEPRLLQTTTEFRDGFASSPYSSIDVIFNQVGVFGNLQRGVAIEDLSFDVSDSSLWHPLYKQPQMSVTDAERSVLFPRIVNISAADQKAAKEITQDLYEKLTQYVQSQRYKMSRTTGTAWSRPRSLTTFLEQGVSLLAEIDKWHPSKPQRRSAVLKLEEWRNVLCSLTPEGYKLQYLSLIFNHINVKTIGKALMSKVPFLKENDPSMLFSIGLHVRALPSKLFLCYVIAVGVSKIRKEKDSTGPAIYFFFVMVIITKEELSEHSDISSCWIAIHGKVYDITHYLNEHPGGIDVLKGVAGEDATEEFEEASHSMGARKAALKYEIGTLEGFENAQGALAGKKVAAGRSSSAIVSSKKNLTTPILVVAFAIVGAVIMQKFAALIFP